MYYYFKEGGWSNASCYLKGALRTPSKRSGAPAKTRSTTSLHSGDSLPNAGHASPCSWTRRDHDHDRADGRKERQVARLCIRVLDSSLHPKEEEYWQKDEHQYFSAPNTSTKSEIRVTEVKF